MSPPPGAAASRARTWLAILVYCLLAVWIGWLGRFKINPDSIAYIQAARHYVHGPLDMAVSSWWSPFLPWLLAPLVALKIDPVLGIRGISALSGLGFAAAAAAMVNQVTGGAGRFLTFLLGLAAALLMLSGPLTPDMVFACCLTWYLALAFRLLDSDSLFLAAVVGLLGGICYLVKAYALPFVAAHLGLTVFLKWLLAKPRLLRTFFRQYLAAVGALLLVAAPWILAISLHDGRFTINSASRYWTAMEPLAPDQVPPLFFLQASSPGRITVWEDPMEIQHPWLTWSPLDGLSGLKKQLRVIYRNLPKISALLDEPDWLGLLKMGLLLGLVFLFPPGESLKTPQGRWTLWACLSVLLFLAGYSLLVVHGRYLWPIWGLLFGLCVLAPMIHLPAAAASKGTGSVPAQLPQGQLVIWHRVGLILLGVLLTANVLANLLAGAFGQQSADAAALKIAAGRLPAGQVFAANKWHEGLYLTYWNKGKFLGAVMGSTPDQIAQELAPFGQVKLLIFGDPPLASALAADHQFTQTHRESVPGITVFERRSAADTARQAIGQNPR